MRTLLLTTCALFLLAACGGSRADSGDASMSGEPMVGDVVGDQILCEVGAIKWRDDGLLTVAFWCDETDGFEPGDEVAMVDEVGSTLALAQVHRIDAEGGAMSLRVREADLIGDLVEGTPFRIALP